MPPYWGGKLPSLSVIGAPLARQTRLHQQRDEMIAEKTRISVFAMFGGTVFRMVCFLQLTDDGYAKVSYISILDFLNLSSIFFSLLRLTAVFFSLFFS